MITIKHIFIGVTLCEFDVETVKHAAEKGKSNLREANLDGADLAFIGAVGILSVLIKCGIWLYEHVRFV